MDLDYPNCLALEAYDFCPKALPLDITSSDVEITARKMGGEVRDILMQLVAAERPAMVTT